RRRCRSPPSRYDRRAKRSLDRGESKDIASFRGGCGATVILAAQIAHPGDQFGITLREALAIELDVVLEAGAPMSTQFKRPSIDLKLMTPDPRRRPGRVGHNVLEFRNEKFQHLTARRQRVGNAEDKLNMQRTLEQTAIGEFPRSVEHREVEDLDFRLHI